MITTISTGRLRDGDMIHIWGATIKIEGKPDVAIGRGGQTVWMWPNQPIIAGSMEPFPEVTRWTIQGDTLTYWRVQR